jgi:hypothetical protein
MGLGATISVGALVLAAVMGFVFFLNYHYVIENEERKLPSVFGPDYEAYCKLVPRFIPQIKAPPQEELEKLNSDLSSFEFSSQLAHENKSMEAIWSFFGIIAGCALLVWVKFQMGWIE